MPSYDVAHIREQGQDMLLFPLGDRFGRTLEIDQRTILAELERRAHAAGLAGEAAAVWQSGGRTYTLGPRSWAGFLRSIDLRFVMANVNRKISW
jgi:hypothetical protein